MSTDQHQKFDFTDLASLKFAMQVILTAAILTLCVGKLTTSDKPDDKALYWGGITGLIAWWMPSPNGSQSSSSNGFQTPSLGSPTKSTFCSSARNISKNYKNYKTSRSD